MGLILLILFIAVPLIEIALFIQIGGAIGLWPTLAVVIITALLGSAALRMQGLAVMNRARHQMDQGELPARELFDGFCLVIAGALLLTPGFFTDAVGALLFIPPFRDLMRRVLGDYMRRHGDFAVYQNGRRVDPDSNTIDGDYEDVTAPRDNSRHTKEPPAEILPPEQPGRGWGPKGSSGDGR